MQRLVKVTANLASPLALSPDGVPPHLDALCDLVMARKSRSIAESKNGHRHDIDMARPRGQPVDKPGQLPTPIIREWVTLPDGRKLPISRCSQGIIQTESPESVERYHCSFPVERAGQLREKDRTKINPASGVYKSQRLPLRIANVPEVVWFAELRQSPKHLRAVVNEISFLGKKSCYGYGQVSEWIVEPTDIDAAWFAESPIGTVLMRPLPVELVPDGTLGARKWYGGVCGPYWQANLFCECFVPS